MLSKFGKKSIQKSLIFSSKANCARGLFNKSYFFASCKLLFAHRLRSLLSTLGVMFGVVAVVSMLSIGEGARQEILDQIKALGMCNFFIKNNTQATESKPSLTWMDAELIKSQLPDLKHLVPIKMIKANASIPMMTPEIIATTPAFGQLKEFRLAAGRFISDLDQTQRRAVCILGYEIFQTLGVKGGIGKTLNIGGQMHEIIGVLQPMHWKKSNNHTIFTRNFDQVIFLPIHLRINEYIDELIVNISSPHSIHSIANIVKNILKKSHRNFESFQFIIPQELLEQAEYTQKTFNVILGAIAAVSLLVGGIGIMNMMLANISERQSEIGIRRALGANRKNILLQFLIETMILTLTGAIFGLIVGIGCSFFINWIAGWRTVVTFDSILLSLSMSALVGLASGLYPAYRAAKMNPIHALKS